MSRTTSIILLVVQFIPLILFPPNIVASNSQIVTIPVFLVLLTISATVAVGVGSVSAWPRSMLVFAQGLNIVSRLMMLLPQAMPNKTDTNPAVVLAHLVSIVISGVALYMFDQYQLNVRAA